MSRSGRQDNRARDERSRAPSQATVVAGLAVTLLLFSGCLSGEESDTARQAAGFTNHPPVVKTASIMPSPLTRSGPLTVRVEAQDLDLNSLSFRYRWLVNGKAMAGQAQASLPPELLKRGDQVVVEVTPFDGTIVGAPVRSAPSSVVNTAPILSDVLVDFDHRAQGRQVLATVNVVDPDQDSVSLTYQWLKNETVVKEGESNTLDLGGLTAKDIIRVNVTASDGNPDGTATVSGRFTMSNSAPTIVSKPHLSPKGDQFDYLVQATDPDGDSITYALDVAPPGMTIEASTGRIRWGITPDVKGSYQVRVVAKDPQGGFAVQEFELSIKATGQA
ncbi:putative Ig domain-containing protein [Petrachloros mirabilis]